MSTTLDQQLGAELDALRDARTYKRFLTLESAQGAGRAAWKDAAR